MKLKVYRISLLCCLMVSCILSIYFLILSIQNVIGVSKENLMDAIMYIVCLVLNLAFLGLEIHNTFYSFKTGSNFAKNLSFNEDGSLNSKFLVILAVLDVFVLGGIVYLSIIYKGVYDLPLNQLAPLAKAVSIAFLVTVFVNITYTLLFPLLGKEDPSLQQNNKKTPQE